MRKQLTFIALLLVGGLFLAPREDAVAKPSLGGHGGGGGARPAMGGGGGPRPSMGQMNSNMSRPGNVSRPSMSNVQRPSAPNVSRPATLPSASQPNFADRPSLGGIPSANTRPALNRPATGVTTHPSFPGVTTPGAANRPAISQPGALHPTTRPNLDRPTIGDRPSISPQPSRPGLGDLNRPNLADRPGAGNPGAGNRPDRPMIGGGNNSGNHNGNIVIGGGNTIVAGNQFHNNNFNRPSTLPANRPNWGWGANHDWHDHWQNSCINNHYHGWYNGCWHGGNYWYAPLALGATYWGLNSLSSWGYGPTYYNPYYAAAPASAAPAYDYSQPVVVNNYVTTAADGAAAAPTPASTAQATAGAEAAQLIDEALVLFKSGDYNTATSRCDAALRKSPGDAVVHEVRALCLFAQGDYRGAAAALNALLANAPGMDWTTMSSLYPSGDVYTKQLRALETHCRSNSTDAAAAFVLAYQYLVLDEKTAAADALRTVVKQQPQDLVARRLLDSVAPPDFAAPPATAPANVEPNTAPQPSQVAAQPQTDLVGKWKAAADDATIELAIDEKSRFTWKATPKGKPPVELAGEVAASSDFLVLETKDRGKMVGRVKSGGTDSFQFTLAGDLSTAPGLAFVREK